jgi:hypothetical protein
MIVPSTYNTDLIARLRLAPRIPFRFTYTAIGPGVNVFPVSSNSIIDPSTAIATYRDKNTNSILLTKQLRGPKGVVNSIEVYQEEVLAIVQSPS